MLQWVRYTDKQQSVARHNEALMVMESEDGACLTGGLQKASKRAVHLMSLEER